jgi:hypothetical protein
MFEIEVGREYSHIVHPTRTIIVLSKPKTCRERVSRRRKKRVKVQYINTTNKNNIGLIANITTKFLRRRYVPLPRKTPDWEV